MVAGVHERGNPASVREARVAASSAVAASMPKGAWASVGVVVLFALGLYLPTLSFPLLFDDSSLIGPTGPIAHGAGWLPYRPLRHVSYLADSFLGGSPVIYHAHNILLHALCAASAVVLAMSLGASALAAAVAVLIATAHPAAVEVVAYVAGRRDLLVALGVLLSVLAWTRGRLGLALLLAVSASLAKESGLVAFGLLGMTALLGAGRDRMRELGGVVLVSLAALATVVAYGARGPWLAGGGLSDWAYVGRIVAHYAGSLWGFGLGAVEHPWLLEFDRWAEAASALELLPWVALGLSPIFVTGTGLCFVAVGRGREAPSSLMLSGLWVVSVFTLLTQWGGLHEPGVDRHAYVVVWLMAVFAAILATRVPAGGVLRTSAVGVSLLMLASFSWQSMSFSERWSSPLLLWGAAFEESPGGPRAGINYAAALAEGRRLHRAASVLARTQSLRPEDPAVYEAVAVVACRRGRRAVVREALANAWRVGGPPDSLVRLGRECGLVEFSDVPAGEVRGLGS